MIQLTYRYLDVEEYLKQGHAPADIVDKGELPWLVCERPLGDVNAADSWSWAIHGDKVRIPVYPHNAVDDDTAKTLAYAVQIAFMASLKLRRVRSSVRRIHVVLGATDTATENGVEHHRFWIGCALEMSGTQ